MRVDANSASLPANPETPASVLSRYAPEAAPVGSGVRTSHHFAEFAGSRVGILAGAICGTAAIIAGGLIWGPAGVIGGAVSTGFSWLIMSLFVSRQKAEEEFYVAYAEERGLLWMPGGQAPPATPLLRMGERRRLEQTWEGDLPGGLPGKLCHYTYEKSTKDPGGASALARYPFTIVTTVIPATMERIVALYVQRRRGFRFLDGAEDVFRRNKRIRLESEALDRDCEIFAHPASDDVWMRRLFSPSFVHYLAEETPPGFAFEVENGMVCCNVRGHLKAPEALDELCEHAARVANRLCAELSE